MTSPPKTMRAWQQHFGKPAPQLVELPVPPCPNDGLLIKVAAAGICHSDVGLLAMPGKPADKSWPFEKYTLGHEGCGKIVQVGSEVKDFAIGDVVSILAVPGCQASSCGECTRDLAQICQSGERYGIGYNGSYAEYITVKSWSAIKVPEGVSPEVASVATDACLTAYHAVVGTGGIKAGETVIIVGIGGLGFNALQIALARGAKVIVVDKRKEILGEAVRFGIAEDDVVPAGESIVEFVKRKGFVVDTIVDFVGVPETFKASQEAVRFGGKIVQVGLLAPKLELENVLAVRKHLSILCSYGGTMEDLKACLDLIAEAKLRPQVETGKFEDLPKILEDLHAGKVKSRIAIVP